MVAKWHKRNGQLLAWPERDKKREHILEIGLDGKFAVPEVAMFQFLSKARFLVRFFVMSLAFFGS